MHPRNKEIIHQWGLRAGAGTKELNRESLEKQACTATETHLRLQKVPCSVMGPGAHCIPCSYMQTTCLYTTSTIHDVQHMFMHNHTTCKFRGPQRAPQEKPDSTSGAELSLPPLAPPFGPQLTLLYCRTLPPPCASTATVPKSQAKQRFTTHPRLRQDRACVLRT